MRDLRQQYNYYRQNVKCFIALSHAIRFLAESPHITSYCGKCARIGGSPPGHCTKCENALDIFTRNKCMYKVHTCVTDVTITRFYSIPHC